MDSGMTTENPLESQRPTMFVYYDEHGIIRVGVNQPLDVETMLLMATLAKEMLANGALQQMAQRDAAIKQGQLVVPQSGLIVPGR